MEIAAGFLDLFLNMKAFFSLTFAKMKLSFLHTVADPNFQLEILAYQVVSNTHSLLTHIPCGIMLHGLED